MSDSHLSERVGEVMASHSQRVEVQCYRLYGAPPLGAPVRVGSPPVYAVVREIWHEPLDPSRPLAPRGADSETEDEVYAGNPQLSAMLTTRFTATTIGFGDAGAIRPGLPSQPPILHAFVFRCEPDELAKIGSDLRWLRLLLGDAGPAPDASVVGILRRAANETASRRDFLVQAGKALAVELSSEPQRLQSILREMNS